MRRRRKKLSIDQRLRLHDFRILERATGQEPVWGRGKRRYTESAAWLIVLREEERAEILGESVITGDAAL